ncbi:MAG: T9SS type A sorting domain-containing protein [Candidatus Zixiibacteriota bacterium]
MKVAVLDGNTRALVYSFDGETVPVGAILSSPGQLLSVEAADPTGAALNSITSVKPVHFALHQNYPNPFNPTTKIRLELPQASEWRISIYNISGQVVEEFDGYAEAGSVSVDWDASTFASGIYFYKAQAGSFSQTLKMALVK